MPWTYGKWSRGTLVLLPNIWMSRCPSLLDCPAHASRSYSPCEPNWACRGCHPTSHMQTDGAMRYPIVLRISLMTMMMMEAHQRAMMTPTWKMGHTKTLKMMEQLSPTMKPHPLTTMTTTTCRATLTLPQMTKQPGPMINHIL